PHFRLSSYILPRTHSRPTSTSPLPLPDALPISHQPDPGMALLEPERHPGGQPAAADGDHDRAQALGALLVQVDRGPRRRRRAGRDRKSTRLNSSHGSISYAVFCLKTESIAAVYD